MLREGEAPAEPSYEEIPREGEVPAEPSYEKIPREGEAPAEPSYQSFRGRARLPPSRVRRFVAQQELRPPIKTWRSSNQYLADNTRLFDAG